MSRKGRWIDDYKMLYVRLSVKSKKLCERLTQSISIRFIMHGGSFQEPQESFYAFKNCESGV